MAVKVYPSQLEFCIEDTCHLLMNEKCGDVSFSSMPSDIVQGILSRMFSRDLNGAKIAHSVQLLSSGKVTEVDLSQAKDLAPEDYVLLLRALAYGCEDLRTLKLPRVYIRYGQRKDSDEEHALQDLLQKCINLKELHSNIYFDPNDLGECRKLRRLKLHLGCDAFKYFSNRVTSDVLKRLGSLKVFTRCYSLPYLRYTNENTRSMAVGILDVCLKLTSLGFLDSSMAIHDIHCRDGRSLETARHFKLKRCFWATEEEMTSLEYCNSIRIAALSCPLVEVLVIRVMYAGCLQHLMALDKLTSLVIDFNNCKDEYIQEFYSLLEGIGCRLQCLSVFGPRGKPLRVNLMCSHCPHLVTLRLLCEITVVEPVDSPNTPVDLSHLRRLNLAYIDRDCLLLLLSNCTNLKVLSMRYCDTFCDSLLEAILKKNLFAKLKVALVYTSSLPQLSLSKFVQSAQKLRMLSLGSRAIRNCDEVTKIICDLYPKIEWHPADDYFELEEAEFPLTCWL